MKTIKLLGNIADQYRSDWELDVKTPSEALRAINANRPGFLDECDAGNYVVLLLDLSNADNVRQVTMDNGLGDWGDEVLCVVPKVSGDTVLVLGSIGGLLVAYGPIIGTIGAYISTYAVQIAFVLKLALTIAVSMVASLISGSPDGFGADETEEPENKPSYILNGVVNTAKQGHRIPVLYGGPLLVGSMVLSSRVNTKDI